MNHLIVSTGFIEKLDDSEINNMDFEDITDKFINLLTENGYAFYGELNLTSEAEISLQEELLNTEYENAIQN